jgi:DNA repair photolyase
MDSPPVLPPPIHGRGTAENPRNRFERLAWTPDPERDPDEEPTPATEFLVDDSQSLITRQDSPDLPHQASFNPYRGCEHGCIYCYARPYHEYLGMSAGLDFETRILVKTRAPELLRAELSAPGFQPVVMMVSGVTDCYQPAERHFRITRRCLEVAAEFRNPVGIISKNRLVARDVDVLQELARHRCVAVTLSITTLKPDLARVLEPRASAPAARLDAIRTLAAAGVPVGVNVAPIIPGLNDEEVPQILQAAADAGAGHAGYTIVRLPHGVADLFSAWLDRHAPAAKNKVLHRIQSLRGGKLNDPRFGTRMTGEGIFADQIAQLFELGRRKAGISAGYPHLSTENFRSPHGRQMSWMEA